MTMTVPCRRIVRHFSHIGLTLALTFTIPLWMLGGERRHGTAPETCRLAAATKAARSMQRQRPRRAEGG
jgi:hypothetical protein